MIKIIIAIGVLLVLAIILAIFRVHKLVDVFRGTEKKYVTASNKVNAALFLVFLIVGGIAFFWYSIAEYDRYQIPIASKHGVVTDNLFWVTMWITGAAFLLCNILLFGFSFFYQHKKERSAYFYPDNGKLELLWSVIPAIVLAILVFTGWKAWSDVTSKAPDDAEVIEVMGYQFAWKTRYPGKSNKLGAHDYQLIDAGNPFGIDLKDKNSFDDFSPLEMHLPKGKPVLFKIRARDVLHSVFAPHFRLKMDAVPGMPTRFWFIPEKSTEDMRQETGNPDFDYEIACTEICGRGHFSMRLKVVVDEPEEYEKWKAAQQTWLAQNPEYLEKVPAELREMAKIAAGIQEDEQ
ncbi:cytochrome c oxidase subunit II [Xanthovirga aplysinae]|uniref:cytochrome c oxidase subunit II n=1 Tax=Xanthovirga aplysinae TaxID=2529853 RepID=UPI0012BBCAF4|nr:cytochrome c oxidase subunit II [Xanthovirga aplysinae]MTI33281.1 cytochrome c oxidase subunit II [Xanthovirga aplysinae]